MKKIIFFVLSLFLWLDVWAAIDTFEGSAVTTDTAIEGTASAKAEGSDVKAGGSGCSTCSTGLTQAFILDDGNQDDDDWVAANDLTISGAAFHAEDYIGLVFDGTDDFASFTPTTTDWQGGYAVAILCTIPNTQNDVIFHADNSGDTNRRIRISSNEYTAYNRMQAYMGREYENNTIYLPQCGEGDSTEAWYFVEYNGTNSADIYKNDATTPCYTDSDTPEYGTVGLNRARLGSTPAGADFAATTIKRVLIYSRGLTSTERQAIMDGWTPTKS